MTLGKILALFAALLAVLALVFNFAGSGPVLLILCGAVLLLAISNLVP